MPQRFSLKAFQAVDAPLFEIRGSISRREKSLHLSFTLSGPLLELSLPLPAPHPERRYNLWKESCFELFLAPYGLQEYWEVNLSPAGHWNIFRFDGYRQGMQQENRVASLPCRILWMANTITLETSIDLGSLGLSGQKLQLGISTVILSKSYTLTYWALAHPCLKPDFHERKGFILTL